MSGMFQKVGASIDPAGGLLGAYGKDAQAQNAKFDPLGQLAGFYGQKNKFAYDPIGLRMGLYGYDIPQAQDPNSFDYGFSKTAQQRASASQQLTGSSTSGTLLGG